jgi:hypothetical protein
VEDSAFCKKTISGEEGDIPRVIGGNIEFTSATAAATPDTVVARDSSGNSAFARLDATELHVNNPVGDTRIELGGAGNVYMDLKNPNSDDYDLRIQASGTDPRIFTNAAKLLVDGTVVALQSVTNGDVGIGTNAPLSKVDVVENQTGQTAVRAYNPDTAGASSAGFIAQQGGVTANFLANANTELSVGTLTSHPVILKSNNTNQVYLTSGGNVGIGIALPSAKLNVQDSSAGDVVRITQQGLGAPLRVEDETTDTTPFIIDGDGLVGIGLATPTAKVHINSTAAGVNCLLVEDDTNPDTTPFVIDENGNTGIATTTPLHKLHVVGGIRSTTATDGIGYATGAGGTVTQLTSRTTPVTIDKVCGSITMFSVAGSTTAATFTVNNSAVEINDTVIINQRSGTNLYDLLVTAVAAGSFNITFRTTGGTATDAPVINFSVIKAVTS